MVRQVPDGKHRRLLRNQQQNGSAYETQPLGTGAFGTVLKGRLKGSGESGWRAIKKIPKKKVKDPTEFAREIEILQKLDHPNIIKLYETFEDSRNVYMITEYTFQLEVGCVPAGSSSTRSFKRDSSLRKKRVSCSGK